MRSILLYMIIGITAIPNIYAQEDIETSHHLLHERIGHVKKALLTAKFSKRKKLLKTLELPSLTALSYYPELMQTHIVFRKKRLPYSMNAQPTVWSLFRHANKRKYIIRVNHFLSENSGFVADSLEFNAQVGLIGHEFAHIAYYQSKTGLQLMGEFIKYGFSKKFRRKYETETDLRTVEHGLAYQLLSLARFLETSEKIPKKYRKKHSRGYMQTHEIEHVIKR